MSRIKTAVARLRRIEFNKACRRADRSALHLANHVWRCVVSHSSKGHRLQLKVDDDEMLLECVVCGIPVVTGSDDVMEAVTEQMTAGGIEFEVLCETKQIHEVSPTPLQSWNRCSRERKRVARTAAASQKFTDVRG